MQCHGFDSLIYSPQFLVQKNFASGSIILLLANFFCEENLYVWLLKVMMDGFFLKSRLVGSLPFPPCLLPTDPPSHLPPSAREPGSGSGSGLKWDSWGSAGRGFRGPGHRLGVRGWGQGQPQQADGIRLGLQVGKVKSSFHGKGVKERRWLSWIGINNYFVYKQKSSKSLAKIKQHYWRDNDNHLLRKPAHKM